MKYRMIVWHLNHDLAVARGLASNTEHVYPYVDATCGFGSKGVQAVKDLWEARCYEPVAVVECNSKDRDHAMEHAFEFTNHIHQAWNRKDGDRTVQPLHHEGNRSTSVGDVVEIVIEDTLQQGVRYTVAACGFTRI